jgi:hypothetical protein
VTLVSESLDLNQGFRFAASRQTPFGYLVTATLFGTALAADIQGFNVTTQTPQAVVGVLSDARWDGGPADPISLTAWLSAQNQQRVSSLLKAAQSTTAVTFDFTTYQYDPVARAFCRRFWPAAAPLQAMVQKLGSSLSISIDSTPWQGSGVQAWGMSITIVPKPTQQSLMYAVSCQSKVRRPWGIIAAS